MTRFSFNLGDKARDNITGYSGIVTARAEYLTGCRQYLIQSQSISSDGELLNSYWYDEDRMEDVVEESIPVAVSPTLVGHNPIPHRVNSRLSIWVF